MPTPLNIEIRELLARYMGEEISLADFDLIFTDLIWDAPRDADSISLIGEISLRLAEYSNGDWTEDQLRTLLKQALGQYRLVLSAYGTVTHSSSTSSTVFATGRRIFGSELRPVTVSESVVCLP
jgi:hypothetical protein